MDLNLVPESSSHFRLEAAQFGPTEDGASVRFAGEHVDSINRRLLPSPRGGGDYVSACDLCD